ncbi:HNH endonuclease signature motif containing protein, partial [Streptomyces sodiiphilus]|uniref:HNH endonuclease signature motif containing protein n=1 Tax=Streptomyces sodiiphilus TaxID=226217 RepID=UPI0031DDD607
TARDPHCRFPTCSMPAHRCDLDHVRPFDHQRPAAGGLTVPENLMPLCRRHHRLKHTPGWRTHRDPATGRVTWTTPTGHTHTTEPHHYPTHRPTPAPTAGKPQANTCPAQPDTPPF